MAMLTEKCVQSEVKWKFLMPSSSAEILIEY
jgi:hypothetical protein